VLGDRPVDPKIVTTPLAPLTGAPSPTAAPSAAPQQ
jgi:hypothetical protein